MNTLTKEEIRIYNNRKTKILSGIEVFLCKKHNCWLTEKACLKVQKRASISRHKSDGYILHSKSLEDNLCSVCSYSTIIQKLHNTFIKHTKEMPDSFILTCNCCGEVITKDDLPKYNGKPVGKVCNNCTKERQKQMRQERKYRI